MSNKLHRLDRRSFIKAAGALGAVSALPLGLAGCTVSLTSTSAATGDGSSSGDPVKIGILAPSSGNFAVYGNEIIRGTQLYLDDVMGGEVAGRPIEYVIEDSEGNPEVALQKSRKLVEQDEVDLVTGIISSGVLMGVREYYDEVQKLLIVSNAGANPISRGLKSPYIWRASFSNWMMGARMATWLSENVGKKAALIVSDYTAGHNERDSFVWHFQEGGGEVVNTILAPFPAIGDPAPLIADLASTDADFFYVFVPGGNGLSFFKSAVEFDLMSQIPMYTNSAQVSEDVLPLLGDDALGLKSSWLWSYVSDIPENDEFVSMFEEKHEVSPSTFALQAFDAGHVITEMLTRVEGDTSDLDAMIGALAGISFDSPRGPFTLDEATQNPRHDWYLREVVKTDDGALHNANLENLGEIVDPGDDSMG
ncbi:MAG: ABC transporter substrate-binding protein [Chloroflexota bacterium]